MRVVCSGMERDYRVPDMTNFFLAGQDVVRWDVTAVEALGPFRLTIHHPAGTIVEYFHSVSAALAREQAIEDLLTGEPVWSRPPNPPTSAGRRTRSARQSRAPARGLLPPRSPSIAR